MNDFFKPISEPARSLYEAFQTEAGKRKRRSVKEWLAAEREEVLREAAYQAQKLGLRCPTMDEIVAAERDASGSTNYGAAWAYKVTNIMHAAKSSA